MDVMYTTLVSAQQNFADFDINRKVQRNAVRFDMFLDYH